MLVVNSHNEWDQLEEVIVGRVENAVFPPYHNCLKSVIPDYLIPKEFSNSTEPIAYPQEMIEAANQELNEFIQIFKSADVKVRRPDIVDFGRVKTMEHWKTSGFCIACPRDSLLVIGNQIIESPMSWPSRYFEMEAYKSLLLEYFENGAGWVSAPKPVLSHKSFDQNYTVPGINDGLYKK